MLFRCVAAFKDRRFNFKFKGLMETNFVYAVNAVQSHSDGSTSVVTLYNASTIDEACGFALGHFRTSNVPTLSIAIVSVLTGDEVVVFKKQ